MSQLDALRRPGRARGVDQGQNVARLDGLPGGLEVEVVLAGGDQLVEGDRPLLVGVDADHRQLAAALLLGRDQAREQQLLGERDLRARVLEQVDDLGRARRGVDRERRRAEVHGRGVDREELGAVEHQDPDRVAPPDAVRGEAGGDPLHLIAVLAEGPGDLAVVASQGDHVRVRRDGALKRLAQGGGPAGPAGVGGLLLGGAGGGLHLSPPWLTKSSTRPRRHSCDGPRGRPPRAGPGSGGLAAGGR